MKRVIVIVGLALLTLAGCIKEENIIQNEQKTVQQEVGTDLQQLQIDSTALHFVVGWLSNEELLFVEKNDDATYILKSFNLLTKELTTIYESDAIITNVFIHPLKESFLIHTSTSTTAATVKIVTIDGFVQSEVTIESTELEIAWSDVNQSHVLFTAFYDDWSFDVFFFNGTNNSLKLLSIEDPFPKWFGEEQFITTVEELGEENLYVHNVLSEEVEKIAHKDSIYFDTYQDTLFTVKETENEQLSYEIVNANGERLASEHVPNRHNYGEFVTYHTEWLMNDQLVFFEPSEEDMFGMATHYQLMKFDEEGVEMILEHMDDANIACSPDGENCLIGKQLEQVLNMNTYEMNNWLLLEDLPTQATPQSFIR